jgi:dCTP deaminase
VQLGYERIKALLYTNTTGNLRERLIISPILEPSEQLRPGTASVDLRLGHHFTVAKRTKVARLNRQHDKYQENLRRYNDQHFVPMGDFFVLHPRQFVMGETLEWIHLPHNLCGEVGGRSSWARDGLIIATATGIHPNYSGIITLELTNVGEIPLYLHPGLRICQLFLTEVDSAGEPTPQLCTFLGSTEPQNGNPTGNETVIVKEFSKQFDTD